ncbi:Bestrophin, RFP-TM, chloride channel-domain-containing protein [Polychytrium aggregatum]|uniref:Bestrophin, RFP-TM, chloride channel-domain-containing protein n=1 Tax=Polychytrium aggregatum TaxID=110093 RepID=UPI0022FEA328|nr:Bestrophin, RFP-TM, chloride channel-domain-containing protein [Polychytrium aggregatum]KAI9199851.1 Bestrophin, RFP-TM, chloride channel-domain-containing protein [Polychytrium aggregatum]
MADSLAPLGRMDSTKKHSYRQVVRKESLTHQRITNTQDWWSDWKSMFKYKNSVVPETLPPTILFTLFSAAVVAIYEESQWVRDMLPNSTLLISILGIVMGLLLVFRNNTAYDRYYEGRRLWASLQTQARNLTRLIWFGVVPKDEHDEIQKRGAMNLVMAFISSTKNYLRGEYQWDVVDVAPYLAHMEGYSSEGHAQQDVNEQLVLPIEISFHISAYINAAKAAGQIDASLQSSMASIVSNMLDLFTSFERVRNSPVPFIYAVHLKQTLTMYLISLPLQLAPSMGWTTIPVVILASFTLLGIESISGQIENPFGIDENDLPMDDYCDELRDELTRVMMRPAKITPDDWHRPWDDISTHATQGTLNQVAMAIAQDEIAKRRNELIQAGQDGDATITVSVTATADK